MMLPLNYAFVQCTLSKRLTGASLFAFSRSCLNRQTTRCLITNSTSLEKLSERFWLFRDLTEEDVASMRSESARIMEDPMSIISPIESQVFIVPIPKSDRTPIQDLIWKIYGRHKEYKRSALRMIYLIMERLENDELTQALQIDNMFNHRAYFFCSSCLDSSQKAAS